MSDKKLIPPFSTITKKIDREITTIMQVLACKKKISNTYKNKETLEGVVDSLNDITKQLEKLEEEKNGL